MLLAIDIGNSSINMGFFMGDEFIVHRLGTYPLKTVHEYLDILRGVLRQNSIDKAPQASIISSVVPERTLVLETACKELCRNKPMIVTSRVVKWLDFDIENPDELGADRVSLSSGAVELFGVPIAVLDFGTATTVNFIGLNKTSVAKPIFKGGAILPGIGLMLDSLHTKTALLPEVPEVKIEASPSLPGKNTEESMLSGVIYGTMGGVERIISEVEEKEAETYRIALTGGFCQIASGFLKRIDFIEPYLILKGMKSIYEKANA